MIPCLLISNLTVMEQMMRRKKRKLKAMTAKMMNLFLVFIHGTLYVALTKPTSCWLNYLNL